MKRAHELAIEAGLDPLAREPGKPPNWVLFLQQAKEPQRTKYSGVVPTIFGEHDEGTINQLNDCLKVGNTVSAVLCADGHLGYSQPVGAVIAYEDQISISGVGWDIGCGNMAVCLDTRYSDLKAKPATLLSDIRKQVSFGVGRINETPVEHDLFDDVDAWKNSGMEDYRLKAQAQLGTVGSGNHYVDLFYDKEDYVWIGVHFGSRGLGHTTAARHLKAAGGRDGINAPPTVVDVTSNIGASYLTGMELCGRYAYAGREWVVNTVRKIIGGSVTHTVHNHHNYAWKENHGGRDLWVVRKGATPAWPGQQGFIGGSMGEDAVIVEGLEAPQTLQSTIHGAGRAYGRKAAKRTFTKEQMQEWLMQSNVTLSGGDVDESPMAYKRLSDVLTHHADTIKVTHTLRPFAVAMAGDDDFDPWKD